MRIAIIAPPYPLEEAPAPPLGVCYAAAAFEAAGAEVKIIDYIVSGYSPEKLRQELDAFRPDAVGSTSVTMNFSKAAEIVQTAKEFHPSAVTMMGGPHVTFDAENTLAQYPGIDLLVLGEGEDTIRELGPVMKNPGAWPDIRGLAFREGDRVVRTGQREFIRDLDRLPLPARHLLECSRYQALGFPVSIITGRGCPYPCIFCQGRRMVGSKVRYRDPVKIVDEIEEIIAYGFNRINVADDLFCSKKDRARAVCGEIVNRGLEIPWSAFARVNTVDRETLRIMKEAGCDSVSFGIESGNPEMIERIRKKITLEQAREAVEMCKEVGLLAHASFMVGLPGETRETMNDSETFARSLDIVYGYHFLAPFPGTTVREEIEKYDLEILTDDWSRYDANRAIVRTSALSDEDMEAFFAEHDRENIEYWDELEQQYRDGTISDDEFFRVYGKYRMELTFRLLSEDIIENQCTFPLETVRSADGSAEDLLAERVTAYTGAEADIVRQAIADFVKHGFLRSAEKEGQLLWYWTHNRREAFGPSSVTKLRVMG
jgi:anaerobic magnesium-protoporphyrin IX monomethyl ester cyclase